MNTAIRENKNLKIITSPDFNLMYNKTTGYTLTWGKTKDEDPQFCAIGPIIADIEISEVCHQGCAFCYKANTGAGANMTFETFKKVFHKLPRTLTQIAFGIGDIDGNPDLKKIITYCRENDYQFIMPNLTINGSRMTPEWYNFLAANCGAVAVSHYNDDDCFNAVKNLTSRGMTQVNIHRMVSEETFDECMALIDKVKTDERLEKLNATVFLMLKQRGRGEKFNRLTDEHYNMFIEKLFASGIGFGFDSCGAARLLKHGVDKSIEKFITPCESTRESCYINVHGKFYPCSFNEDGPGIEVASCEDFIKDIWMMDLTHAWRLNLLDNNCSCPSYFV
jgi:hypothetical protein